MYLKLKFLLSVVLFLFFVSTTFAAPVVDWSTLNLNSDQTNKILKLDAEWQNKSKALLPKLKENQQKLNQILNNPNSTDQQIRDINKQVTNMELDLQNLAMENFLAKRNILTIDQRKKLLEIIKK